MVAAQHEPGSKERILGAARDLFNLHGFHQSSMAELASSAQVSVGQIYRLFKSKEDIISAIVEVDATERRSEIVALQNSLHNGEIDIEDAFEQLFLTALSDHEEALSFDILAEAFRNGRVGETIAMLCGDLRQCLHDFACAANPNLDEASLLQAKEMIMACMFGFGHRSLSRPELSAATTARGAARMIIAALRGIG
ncbi:TetR/AcrR family transcriptional regulator [Sphingobium sp. DC-2]|uniref:TetR/AcrR family transcriptional regulator n=1 Tax=Sphingobium sp. DC-2 TaxID=1303256 RepID=UPI0004C32C9A|nr:TetR/AcrR family transcriptional regulator [Sphingobium sp. DC-2]